MKIRQLLQASIMTLVLLMSSPFVQAGSQQGKPAVHKSEDIISFAKQVEKFAAKKHARAFILSRLGQAQSSLPNGIEFTHTAIAIYSEISLDDGTKANGYAIYNLYQNAGDAKRSQIVMDYPADFFWGVHELKSGIIIPSEEIQTRLIQAIQKNYHVTLHNPKYSLIANPFNNKYQNCTEHTLNVLNAAIYQTDDMKVVKQSIKNYFEPQRLKISPLKLALGNLFVDGVRTSDHGRKKQTTTFTTIGNYLTEFGLEDGRYTLVFNKATGSLLETKHI
ncbi:DUF2145 domain-containing protein [Psychrosphaera sp. B3R10]|nr:DUF2145 domain-containing protein [Psychrosphaera sp. I2R16]MBU2990228.1 DUF2145 domain-containing protein [Psychrosphaera sp. B3R10]